MSDIDGALCTPLHAGGDWTVAFRGQLHVKFGVVLSGACVLSVDEVAEPLTLIHDDVTRPRSIDELAKAARMSRSAFAEKFKRRSVKAPDVTC